MTSLEEKKDAKFVVCIKGVDFFSGDCRALLQASKSRNTGTEFHQPPTGWFVIGGVSIQDGR